MDDDQARREAAGHLARALAALDLGDDPELARTPQLVADLLAEWRPRPPPPVVALPTQSRDLVVLRDLPFHSLCAHHLLPFFGTCTIAYRPDGAIAGLGWFPRVLQALAQRPQVQERLAAQLADTIQQALGPQALGVRLVARQMCVELRGPRSGGQFEVVALRGAPDSLVEASLR
ncbi:GTP cyclohydrolase I [Myxococcota bacterium]|nr:GTP cyclohydrolase I [Myxococcota bacterium]